MTSNTAIATAALSVSIIIRTAGQRPRQLNAALSGLAAQTRHPADVLVVEDGGSALAGLVARFAAILPGLRHLPIPRSGRSRAGNVGLAAATGAYVGFLDDDDGLYPSHVETLAATLEAHPEVPAVYGRALEVLAGADGRGRRVPWARREVAALPFSRARLWLGNFLPIQAVLCRREPLTALGGFDESLDYLEDWDLWLRLAERGNFLPVPVLTSWFLTPASSRVRQDRAALHDGARPRILAKHAARTGTFTMADLQALHEILRLEGRGGGPGIRAWIRGLLRR